MSHIAFIIPGLDRLAGAESQVLLLARGLRNRGWRVSVITLSGSGCDAAAELASQDIAFLSLEMRKGLADPRGWIRFHRWLRCNRPHIVHAHLPHATWLARWSSLAAPVPVLIDTIHTSATGGPGRRLGYRLSNWLSDAVTAVSKSAALACAQGHMVTPRKLRVIPNGVDTAAWQPDAASRVAARREFGLSSEFVWLAVGRLDPVKDYATLLRAMTAVPEPARLLIAGQGPLETDLKQLCFHLGLESRVRFLGFQHDPRRYMHAADAYVLSSLWEGLPVALLEAAACALPAVVTSVPGTREAVIDKTTALLAPPGSPATLARAMTALMGMPPEARRIMGERARRYVIAHFDLETTLNLWEDLYAGFIAKHATACAASAAPGSAPAPPSHTRLP